MTKKTKTFVVWLLVVIVALGLLGSSGIISLFLPKPELTTRELAFTCTTDMATQFHIHPLLSIIADGKNIEIPANVGVTSACLHPLHTHDATGRIHVESPEKRDFSLADFFAVWGKAFSKDQILDMKADSEHMIKVAVDGAEVSTFENTILRDKQQVVVSYEAIK